MSTPTIPTSGAATAPSVSNSLRRFGWFVLAYNVLVVLWGAVVRATGSGAGCGDHWPLCNGVAIPKLMQFHTMIEFTHRLMSGATLIIVFVLLVWTWRATARGALARWAAVASMILVLNEALLGALLVLLRLVAHNQSAARGVYLSFHFANTLLLLGCLALLAEFLSRPRMRMTTAWRKGGLLFPALGLGATLVVGVSGSLAALGDTLYPATSLANALQQDFSATSSLLLRLRWLHPASAFIAGAFILWIVIKALGMHASGRARSLAIAVIALLFAQYAIGAINIVLLAPLWIQILHLFFADLLWICLVLLATHFSLSQHSAPASLRQ